MYGQTVLQMGEDFVYSATVKKKEKNFYPSKFYQSILQVYFNFNFSIFGSLVRLLIVQIVYLLVT